jgi:oxalate decarboxylase/phosphoglucose isomerase-like protein (cupin superfamily)
MSEPDIRIGNIAIKVLISNELIESFDSDILAPDTGPGLHYHAGMDEVFYIQSGKVLITAGAETILATPGMIVRVPKMTPHSWKSQDGPAKLLVTFIPGANQVRYLTELGELSRSGASWEEGIAALQKKYDNTPVVKEF